MLEIGTQTELCLDLHAPDHQWYPASVTKHRDDILILTIEYPQSSQPPRIPEDNSSIIINWIDENTAHSAEGRVAGRLGADVLGIRIQPNSITRHEYAFIDTPLSIDARILDRTQYYAIRPELARAEKQQGIPKALENLDEISPALLRFLGDINHKLDRILDIIDCPDTQATDLDRQFHARQIGGGFFVGTGLPSESYAQLRVALPVYPYRTFQLLGITRQLDPEQIILIITWIRDEDREELIRYVFERQREALKAKRKN